MRGHSLVGISQREVTGFYPTVVEKKDDIRVTICQFFVEKIKLQFESEADTFDVYFKSKWQVKQVNFNPWGGSTIPTLFDWDELENIEQIEHHQAIEFIVIESQFIVRPGLKTAVPSDYLNTSEG